MTEHKHTQALQIAVVGHTNTGKTSLLRTLTRDKRFGEVSAMPSTTRHVEAARLHVGSELLLELFDTPGLEDAIALMDVLDSQAGSTRSHIDGPARIEAFLQSSPAAGRFEQEAKVLRQMLRCDAAVYVIDARDPVLAKFRDELAILNSCAVPILPLLNFVSSPGTHEQEWREALARLGLHVIVSFDTVAPERDGERVLYEKLALLLDARGVRLQDLAARHRQDAMQRRAQACEQVAELLIDVAACRVQVSGRDSELETALREFNERVRAREQACADALLALYNFTEEDIDASPLPFSDGNWHDDLFDPDTLTSMGISLGGGAAAGAAAGFGVDMMLGGASLGTGAAVGALLGGGAQTLRRFGRRLGHSLNQSVQGALLGSSYIRIDDHVLQVLLSRQMLLVTALEGRGHAAVEQVKIADTFAKALWHGKLAKHLQIIRAHPSWSGLYKDLQWDSLRVTSQEQIAMQLQTQLAAYAE